MIDLRSDTVTQPTAGMRAAIARAELGDDGFGDDPEINALQEELAELCGKESAIWVPSGTMANQITLQVYCRPGDQVISPVGAHLSRYEAGASWALAGVQITELGHGGRLPLAELEQAYHPDDHRSAPTRLVTLENTHDSAQGNVVDLEHIEALRAFTRARGIPLHLDGARLFNASVATGIALKDWAESCDSLSLCLSKGLGAPAGSVLVGDGDFVHRAHRYRKMLGGAMRQVGLLGAAGRYALAHHRARLREDHANADHLARRLGERGLPIEIRYGGTNIVSIDLAAPFQQRGYGATELVREALEQGLAILALGPQRVRAVTHLGVSREEIERALELWVALLEAALSRPLRT